MTEEVQEYDQTEESARAKPSALINIPLTGAQCVLLEREIYDRSRRIKDPLKARKIEEIAAIIRAAWLDGVACS